ncbi:MAG: polyprenyl synthetase family protein [Candidatus Hodarchaeales archaeon]
MASVPQEILDLINRYKAPIQEQVLKAVQSRKIKSISPLENKNIEETFWTQLEDYPARGGKYLRSMLICLTCEALGGNAQEAIPTAVAMELSQNWILIHDDIQDESVMRRGDKALHLKIGVEHAINAGDAIHIIMWNILASNIHILQDNDRTIQIFTEFHNMLLRTSVGQTTEMFVRNSYDMTENDVYYILDGKTGYYTIAGPVRLGAILANYKPDEHKGLFDHIDEFGLNLGRAFQIIDDTLDVTSDFEGLKDQKGNDIQEGKRSFQLIKLIQKIKEPDKSQLFSIMNKKMGTRTQDEIIQVITWMEEYGIITEAKKQAQLFANNARKALDLLPFQDEYKKYYEALVKYMVERTH